MAIVTNRANYKRAYELRRGRRYAYSRQRIRQLLQSRDFSISEIAAMIGCSNWPVLTVKKELTAMGIKTTVQRRSKCYAYKD